MKNSKFTYTYYENIINKLLSSGYSITNYHNYRSVYKPCIIRHDVDYDVNKALEFAEFESSIKNKVCSTYFLLITSEFYNVFSLQTLKAIDSIISLGHEIGLHFDETKYSIYGDQNLFRECVEEELFLLGKALGTTIKTVSMHRPSKYTLESNIKFQSAVNSYSQEFFKRFKYISDSRMNWREDIFTVMEKEENRRLHLLTHPFWYDEIEEDTKVKLLRFINRARNDRYKNFSNNFRNLNEFVEEGELE